jgi:hypothetical protein
LSLKLLPALALVVESSNSKPQGKKKFSLMFSFYVSFGRFIESHLAMGETVEKSHSEVGGLFCRWRKFLAFVDPSHVLLLLNSLNQEIDFTRFSSDFVVVFCYDTEEKFYSCKIKKGIELNSRIESLVCF